MSTQNKETVLGDVVKWENPHEYCRSSLVISRDLTAPAAGLPVGECLEPDTAVAQIHTTTNTAGAPTADGGTFRLGYKGQWTTALAFGVTLGDAKTAFELLSTVTDTITFSASPAITGTTATWATTGPKAEIEWDTRLLLDGAVVCGTLSPVSTIGSLVASQVVIATGSNATSILLEKVTQAQLLVGNNIRRACLVRGSSIVDSDQLTVLAAQKADALTALIALGIQMRTEPSIYQLGPPTA